MSFGEYSFTLNDVPKNIKISDFPDLKIKLLDYTSNDVLLEIADEKITLSKDDINKGIIYTLFIDEKLYRFQGLEISKNKFLFSIENISLFPTPIKEINANIMLKLSDKELTLACSANKELSLICKDKNFWRERIIEKIGYKLPKSSKIDYKLLYKHLIRNRIIGLHDIPEFDFYVALRYGNLEIVKYFIEDLNFNIEKCTFRSPIKEASDLEVVKYILDLNISEDYILKEAFKTAVVDNLPKAKIIYEYLNLTTDDLISIIKFKDLSTPALRWLIDDNIIRKNQIYPLFLYQTSIERFYSYGTMISEDALLFFIRRPEIKMKDLRNALINVSYLGNLPLIEILVKNIDDSKKSDIAINKAFVNSRNFDPKMTIYFLENTFITQKSLNKKMSQVAFIGSVEVAKILLEYGADLYYKDLEIAYKNNKKVYDFLLEEIKKRE